MTKLAETTRALNGIMYKERSQEKLALMREPYKTSFHAKSEQKTKYCFRVPIERDLKLLKSPQRFVAKKKSMLNNFP